MKILKNEDTNLYHTNHYQIYFKTAFLLVRGEPICDLVSSIKMGKVGPNYNAVTVNPRYIPLRRRKKKVWYIGMTDLTDSIKKDCVK